MKEENRVFRQVILAYEKIRQDLVGILDGFVKKDSNLVESLDPREIQR